MTTPHTLIMVLVLALLTAIAPAGGSLDTDEIIPILKRDVTLGPWLLENFEFCSVASGRRMGRHWNNLHAARIGPYNVLVRDKKNPGNHFWLTLYTQSTFYNGEKAVWQGLWDELPDNTSELFNSTRFTEKLVSVEVKATTNTRCNGYSNWTGINSGP